MKYVDEFYLRDGMQEEYKRRHDEIWPEMKAMMEKSGLQNYSIWNLGNRLIEYFETSDLEKSSAIIHDDPIKAKWDEYMSDILIRPEGGSLQYRCMFEFNSTENKG